MLTTDDHRRYIVLAIPDSLFLCCFLCSHANPQCKWPVIKYVPQQGFLLCHALLVLTLSLTFFLSTFARVALQEGIRVSQAIRKYGVVSDKETIEGDYWRSIYVHVWLGM
jgi:hypothetical protein